MADIAADLMIVETKRISEVLPEAVDITVLGSKLIEIKDSDLISFLQQDKFDNLEIYLYSLYPESDNSDSKSSKTKPVLSIVPKTN